MPTSDIAAPAAHIAGFCTTEHFLISQITEFVSEGLSLREQVLVVVTNDHWTAVARELDRRDIDYGRAIARGELVIVDAEAALEQIAVQGKVNADRFRDMLMRLLSGPAPKRMYGELVGALTARGDIDGAAQIEAMVHELSHSLRTPILCCYNVGAPTPLTASQTQRLARLHDRSFSEPVPEVRALPGGHFHAVRFYNGSTELSGIVASFLAEGLHAAEPAVVIATPGHWAEIAGQLNARGFDVKRLTADTQLTYLDAAATLAEFMTDGLPERARFRETIRPVLTRARHGRAHGNVRAYGEMVDVLWRQGQTVAATRLEMLWNELAQTDEFSLLCGYSMGHFYKNTDVQPLCAEHSDVASGDVAHLQ